MTGSGKSSAAGAYAEATGLPEFSVDDDIGWHPGWEQRDAEEQRALGAAIVAQDRWVLDSAYGGWRDLVLARAELVVALDYPRWLSLCRLIRRTVRRIVTSQVVCNGNRETMARLFSKDSVVRWHFQSFARKRRIIRDMEAEPNSPRVVVFRRPKDLETWMAGVATGVSRAKSL
ncbi:adenylate kinase [Arthrobacter sp. ov407]|uniref:adenylate kinase n=1 Tax=Arthrobacter sp. ov407 TaxID=1761748 RepID=UPI0021099728|nr:adenylate kinase [Arthrobacter sp. ov407]